MATARICKCKHMKGDHSVNQFHECTFCVIDGCECKKYEFDHSEIHQVGITPKFERLQTNKKKNYQYKRIYSMNNLNSNGTPRKS